MGFFDTIKVSIFVKFLNAHGFKVFFHFVID
jgi:hypothetical protein